MTITAESTVALDRRPVGEPPSRWRSRSRCFIGAAALAAVIATAALAGPASATSGSGQPPSWTVTSLAPVLTLAPPSTEAQYEAAVLAATNSERVSHGLRAFTVTTCLSGFATTWATHLAATKTLVHQDLAPFLSECHAMYAGENIADGNVSAATVVQLWMASPEHRANVLDGHYTHIAIGAALSGTTWYVVQDFSS